MDEVWSVLGPILAAAVLVAFGVYIGFADGRRMVGMDCDRLGTFAASGKVYECKEKKQ